MQNEELPDLSNARVDNSFKIGLTNPRALLMSNQKENRIEMVSAAPSGVEQYFNNSYKVGI
jgi:hypothetical protein